MATKECIEVIAALAIPLSTLLVIYNRIKTDKGIGVRAIQFLTVSVVVPLILILALEGILEKSAVGALVGALIGYMLSHISEYDKTQLPDD